MTDQDLALDLAIARWGRGKDGRPQCPLCPDRTMWRRHDRPRTFGCSGCRRQRSVTSGTVLHAVKLPLEKVQAYLKAHEDDLPPSARALGRKLGDVPSTAWAICMRIKSAIASEPVCLMGRPFSFRIVTKLRNIHRPVPRPHRHAEPVFRRFGTRLAELDAVADALGNLHFAMPCTATELTPYAWKINTPHNKALARRGLTLLHDIHRTVSAGWLSRYIGFLARPRPERLWEVFLRRGPGSMARLRPAGAPYWEFDHDVLWPRQHCDEHAHRLSIDIHAGKAVSRADLETLRQPVGILRNVVGEPSLQEVL